MKTVNKNEPSMNPKYKIQKKKSTSYTREEIVLSLNQLFLTQKHAVYMYIYNGWYKFTIHAISFKVDAMWSISPFF